MNELYDAANAVASSHPGGRRLSSEDARALKAALPAAAWCRTYFELLSQVPLVGTRFVVADPPDRPGAGAEILWLDANDILAESLSLIPGSLLAPHGYLAIGACLLGSGDPYFLRVHRGEPLEIVRAPHDAVVGSGTGQAYSMECLEQVAASLTALLKADAAIKLTRK